MFATCELVDLFVFSRCFSPKAFGKQPHFLFKKRFIQDFAPLGVFSTSLSTELLTSFNVLSPFCESTFEPHWKNTPETPSTTSFKWIEMVRSKHFSHVKILKSTWTNHVLMVVSGFRKVFFGGVRICYDLLFHTTSLFHARGDKPHPFPVIDRSWRYRWYQGCSWYVLGTGDQPKL